MAAIQITDLTETMLEDYFNLTDVALRRRIEPEGGLYIAESAKVIARALAAGHTPRSALVLEQWLPELEMLLVDYEVPIFVGPSELLKQLTGFDMHRGALASMHRPKLPNVEHILANANLVVVLEDIVDHTNVGAIFRSAAALGADAVLISPRCADPLYRRSVRVSMGAVLQVPWTRLDDWPAGADVLHASGFHIAALALNKNAVPLDQFSTEGHQKVALLLGAEGDGLSLAALSHADSLVTIPMLNGVDSLNVAAASAVAMFVMRPRGESGELH
jgi:tRNA G18 (ribose-2'-O)-methylase SpoU